MAPVHIWGFCHLKLKKYMSFFLGRLQVFFCFLHWCPGHNRGKIARLSAWKRYTQVWMQPNRGVLIFPYCITKQKKKLLLDTLQGDNAAGPWGELTSHSFKKFVLVSVTFLWCINTYVANVWRGSWCLRYTRHYGNNYCKDVLYWSVQCCVWACVVLVRWSYI